jgi:hypothetical protein
MSEASADGFAARQAHVGRFGQVAKLVGVVADRLCEGFWRHRRGPATAATAWRAARGFDRRSARLPRTRVCDRGVAGPNAFAKVIAFDHLAHGFGLSLERLVVRTIAGVGRWRAA